MAIIEKARTTMVDKQQNFREIAFTQSAVSSSECDRTKEYDASFWQQWQQHQDYLYRCCIKWMGGNRTNAEDALSRVMIKAWEKVREGRVIKNFKAWLTQLTYNLCVDIYREGNRGAVGVEDLELIAPGEGWISEAETPILAATQRELEEFLEDAIDHLPPRLREPFILYVKKELSYQEIAGELNISYDNVRKRISQARAILRERLHEYEVGEKSTPRQSQKREKSQTASLQTPFQTETLASSGDCEEVRIVADGEQQQLVLCVEQVELVLMEAQSDPLLESSSNSNPLYRRVTQGNWQRILPTFEKLDRLHPLVEEKRSPLALHAAQSLFQLCWWVWADSGDYIYFSCFPLILEKPHRL